MAGKKVKINVKTSWGDQITDNSIKITATTLGDVVKELKKLDEWGEFKGDVGYDYDTENNIVTELRLTPTYTLRMPTWNGYDKAPKACQEEWDRMWPKLEEHEEGHKQIFLDTLDKIEKHFGKATNLSGKQLEAEFKKLIKTGQSHQDKFDTSTGHGSKKGVELIITDECK
jgi:predicted secreted Zn-dependent protease